METAVANRVPQSELPSTLYIVSDMEFNSCAVNASQSNFDNAKALFTKYGCVLPRIVFWNVASRNRQQPVTMNEQGVALVSGCSASVFSTVMSGELSPYALMHEVLGSERYAAIAA